MDTVCVVCAAAHGQAKNGSDGPGEGGLHGIVGWRLAVDLCDDIFLLSIRLLRRAPGNHGLDLQMSR